MQTFKQEQEVVYTPIDVPLLPQPGHTQCTPVGLYCRSRPEPSPLQYACIAITPFYCFMLAPIVTPPPPPLFHTHSKVCVIYHLNKMHSVSLQEGKTAMSNWLPGWWSNELSHWQEFPTNDYNEAFPFHGQDWEDQYAHDFFFYNKKHGTYLEMGGYDGLTFTNTLWLNKALGWRGMLIEASPVQVVY